MRWQTESGSIVVEGDAEELGYASVSLRPGEVIHDVKATFEGALIGFRDSAESALRVFRDDVLGPDEVEIEFGLKLNAAAGAVLAKASAEGHLTVKLRWARESR